MRIWPFGRTSATAPSAPAHRAISTGFSLDGTFGAGFGSQNAEALLEDVANLSGAEINRRDALKASAVMRGRNLLCGTAAALPLELRRTADNSMDGRNWVGRQPDPHVERVHTLAMTFEDLMFYGRSYWRVLRTDQDGKPVHARRLDPASVSQVPITHIPSEIISQDNPHEASAPIYVDGAPTYPGEVIRFLSPNPPLLKYAARSIRVVLTLEAIAAEYSSDPLPFAYFEDATDDEALSDEEILGVINKWTQARKRRRWGYIPPGLRLKQLEWPTPQQLQLTEARNHAVLDIARHMGLDPEDAGVSIPGASRTYQNAVQRRMDLLDFVSRPSITAVEHRLSMDDVTVHGTHARFATEQFTRADFEARVETYRWAIQARMLTPDEAREMEGWTPLTSAQKAELEALGMALPGRGDDARRPRTAPTPTPVPAGGTNGST